MKKNILILPVIVMGLWGCGKKGPLVLEPPQIPQVVVNLGLRQVGNEIELSWKFPVLLSDGKTSMQPAQVRNIYIYHLAKPFVPETFLKKSELLAKPKASELGMRPDGTVAYTVTFKDKMLQDKEHAFALAYTLGRTRSALSTIQKIITRTPPKAVSDLKIGHEGKVVVLNWSRPQVDSEGRPLPAFAGCRVYRRITPSALEVKAPQEGPGKAASAFAPINLEPARGERFEDSDTGVDGEYEYLISSLLDERIESAPSNIVSIKIQDVFPPDVPANLVTFNAADHVFLTWEAVRDRDLDHYIVYRRSDKEENFAVLNAAVGENLFRDRQVVKGQLYVYAIAAVDKKGNESEPCRPARHKFE